MVAFVPAGVLVRAVLRDHVRFTAGRDAHRREVRFSEGRAGPCLIVRCGFTGTKFFCGYFAVTDRMIAIAVEPTA